MENRAIVTEDNFIFADVTDICSSHVRRVELWNVFDLYEFIKEDESGSLLETMDDIRRVLKDNGMVCIRIGQLEEKTTKSPVDVLNELFSTTLSMGN